MFVEWVHGLVYRLAHMSNTKPVNPAEALSSAVYGPVSTPGSREGTGPGGAGRVGSGAEPAAGAHVLRRRPVGGGDLPHRG